MSILPLPVFEADADPRHRSAMTDDEIYASLEPPKSIVVRFGSMKLVGEFPYDGEAKPGCGSKLVIRTHRGTEIGEMLTSTCANSGCSKSVSRNEMLDYIENSGGREYPFHTEGRILRVATIDDLNAQSSLDTLRVEAVKICKTLIIDLGLRMKLVESEPILGAELLTFYYMSEERVDFRELVRQLASHFKTRIEMRQVGARDEARLVADYERCGQHCCCKNFLKVLTPVSMSAAKRQKATLEPLKISGRCGRLMCCLRYEDQTYKELRAALPKRNSRVGTAEGPGVVVDSKVLVQLVLVRLDFDGKEIAVPVEELMDPDNCPPPGTPAKAESDALRGLSEEQAAERVDDRKRRDRSRQQQQDKYRQRSKDVENQREMRDQRDKQDETATPDDDAQDREPGMVDFDSLMDPDRGADRDVESDSEPQTAGEDSDDQSTSDRAGRKRRRGGRRRRRGGQQQNRRDGGGSSSSPSAPDQPQRPATGDSPGQTAPNENDRQNGGGRRRRRGGKNRRRRGGGDSHTGGASENG